MTITNLLNSVYDKSVYNKKYAIERVWDLDNSTVEALRRTDFLYSVFLSKLQASLTRIKAATNLIQKELNLVLASQSNSSKSLKNVEKIREYQ